MSGPEIDEVQVVRGGPPCMPAVYAHGGTGCVRGTLTDDARAALPEWLARTTGPWSSGEVYVLGVIGEEVD